MLKNIIPIVSNVDDYVGIDKSIYVANNKMLGNMIHNYNYFFMCTKNEKFDANAVALYCLLNNMANTNKWKPFIVTLEDSPFSRYSTLDKARNDLRRTGFISFHRCATNSKTIIYDVIHFFPLKETVNLSSLLNHYYPIAERLFNAKGESINGKLEAMTPDRMIILSKEAERMCIILDEIGQEVNEANFSLLFDARISMDYGEYQRNSFNPSYIFTYIYSKTTLSEFKTEAVALFMGKGCVDEYYF